MSEETKKDAPKTTGAKPLLTPKPRRVARAWYNATDSKLRYGSGAKEVVILPGKRVPDDAPYLEFWKTCRAIEKR